MQSWKVDKLLSGETIISKEPENSMTPLIKSKQPVELTPIIWEEAEVVDIVYYKVRGNLYTHLVKSKSDKRGCLIGSNRVRVNGWTKKVYGKVT